MDMKKLVAAIAVAGWTVAQAAVSVTNVKVQQRWPWNGKVDIDYEVVSDNADDSVFVYPLAKENDRNIAIAPRTLSGDGVDPAMVGARVKPGKHRMTWDMSVDEPTLHSSSFTVTLHAVKGGMYLVVDLSGGPTAEKYPIRYSDTPPDITSDLCRTGELWLRLCLPGTFMMGSPTDEPGRQSNGYYTRADSYLSYRTIGYENLHQVTLTKPFYIGVFEFTQRQYELIKGVKCTTSSGYTGDLRPACGVSWHSLRGFVAGEAYPEHTQVDPDSFFGILRSKTGCLFDLPTEAQWEYACRAGTSTPFNDGKEGAEEANIKKIARYSANYNTEINGYTYNYHTAVGQYQPNAWGLYDMHGNVREWCLDWYKESLGKSVVTDPVGPSKRDAYTYVGNSTYIYRHRVVRGGSAQKSGSYMYGSRSQACRSACRYVDERGNSDGTDINLGSLYRSDSYGAPVDKSGSDVNTGFRVVVTPVVE